MNETTSILYLLVSLAIYILIVVLREIWLRKTGERFINVSVDLPCGGYKIVSINVGRDFEYEQLLKEIKEARRQ